MVISCFFCQNLLSDYVEAILPSGRHEELKGHLAGCPRCEENYKDLQATLKILKSFPPRRLPYDLALHIVQASEAGQKTRFTRSKISRISLVLAVPLLVLASLVVIFPGWFPPIPFFHSDSSEAQFVRYYPLLQGATEILEEQGTWLHGREPLMGSLWEEGGLSPEDFEKTFQVKAGRGVEK